MTSSVGPSAIADEMSNASRMRTRQTLVYCAGSSWDGVPGTDHHMARELSLYAPVLYVNPAQPAMTARRHRRHPLRASASLESITPNLSCLTPIVLPGMTRAGVRVTTGPLVRRAISQAVRTLRCEVSSIVVATVDDLLTAVPADRRVFYGTDDYVSGADLFGVSRAALCRSEERQLEKATDVVAVSEGLLRRWSSSAARTHLLPNGCDADHYKAVERTPPPGEIRLQGPVAGFVGHLNARIDLGLLEAVADRGVSVLMVGPVDHRFRSERFERLVSRDNVQWVGLRPYAALPSYMRVIDVGLTPYADTAFNRESFPLKTLEYLAAGRAAVTTDLPASRWLDTTHIQRADGAREFVEATLAALAVPKSAAVVAQRRDVAERHSWASRAAGMAAVLGWSGDIRADDA